MWAVPQPRPQPAEGCCNIPAAPWLNWQPDKAVAEAQRDLAAGRAKIYVSGTEYMYEPGVAPEQLALVEALPRADAGIGCDMLDVNFRGANLEYAERYNQYVVQHLAKR